MPCEHFEDDTGAEIVGMVIMVFVVIFLIADFAGRTADKILFIPEGMFGDPAPSF